MIAKEQPSKQDDVNPEYRCERCWSSKDINLYSKSIFLGENVEGFVVLCNRCKSEVPDYVENEIIFKELFLRFASVKELIKHYNAKNENEAKEIWCSERGIEISVVRDETIEDTKPPQKIENEEQHTSIGYELVEGKLSVKEDEAEKVRTIFEQYLSGKTMEGIARNFNKESEGREKWFTVGMVRAILKDPIYAGYIFKGKEIVRGEHEPIIDKEKFNKVQQRIVRNIRNPKYLYEPLILGE